ncbi:MAG: sigma-54-dependent Fis family transcriptional regulator [Deltaproteobacteria bacterium]|nr:sigma-54-dependent Fis family transcriptional regulator [Deltaproteobacteria bacterium]
MAKILVIDDELSMREFLQILLEKEGYEAAVAASANAALKALAEDDFDLIISDIRMPGMSGLDFLEQIRAGGRAVPLILITAYASPEDAVSAMKGGAYDYITKPFNVDEIKQIVRSALMDTRASAPPSGVESFQNIIGQSPAMLKIFDLIKRIAPTHANILIQGESGTGKELVAQAIHKLSKAAGHRFVPIICNAIPESLFESEVFGHAKGAFTGATTDKGGLFAEADKGSVFLDEVGELTPLIQTKLLRVIQEREFKPVGSPHVVKINVRVITATNRDLEQEVIAGRFREDLFYRLAVVPIRVPPLRERKGDVPLLVRHFLRKYAKLFAKNINELSSYAMEVLMNYDFPGNVRELENIIERGVALETSNIILPESLKISVHKRAAANTTPGRQNAAQLFDIGMEEAVVNLEKEMISKALMQAGNSKMKAAEILKISFRSLRYKIKKYGIACADLP